MAVLAMVVSMVTIQLYSMLRRREFEHRMNLEEALHEKSNLLRERNQVKKQMLLQQLELLDSEIGKLSKNPELLERLETSQRLINLIRTTLNEEATKP